MAGSSLDPHHAKGIASLSMGAGMVWIARCAAKLTKITSLAAFLCVGASANAQEPFSMSIRPWSTGTKAATHAQRFGWCTGVSRRGTGSRITISDSDTGEFVGYSSYFDGGASPFPCSEEIAWQYQTLLVFPIYEIPQPAILERASLIFRKRPVTIFSNNGDCDFRLDWVDGRFVIGDEVADNPVSRARLPLQTKRLTGNDQWRWSSQSGETRVRLEVRATIQRMLNGHPVHALVLGPNPNALHLRDNRNCVNDVRDFRLYVKGLHLPR